MINRAGLARVGKFPIALFFVAVHTDHLASILPVVAFFLVMALIAAVVLVATWRDHPICDVSEELALMWNVYFPFSHHAYLFDKLLGIG